MRVHISSATYDLLKNHKLPLSFEKRRVHVKGKGVLLTVFRFSVCGRRRGDGGRESGTAGRAERIEQLGREIGGGLLGGGGGGDGLETFGAVVRLGPPRKPPDARVRWRPRRLRPRFQRVVGPAEGYFARAESVKKPHDREGERRGHLPAARDSGGLSAHSVQRAHGADEQRRAHVRGRPHRRRRREPFVSAQVTKLFKQIFTNN